MKKKNHIFILSYEGIDKLCLGLKLVFDCNKIVINMKISIIPTKGKTPKRWGELSVGIFLLI